MLDISSEQQRIDLYVCPSVFLADQDGKYVFGATRGCMHKLREDSDITELFSLAKLFLKDFILFLIVIIYQSSVY